MKEQHSAGDQAIAPSAKRSISSLLANLSKTELERLAVGVILQNRHYLERAQDLYDQLQGDELGNAGNEDNTELHHNYHLALITLNGHHQVVSAVISALGYVPTVPGDLEDDSRVSSLN